MINLLHRLLMGEPLKQEKKKKKRSNPPLQRAEILRKANMCRNTETDDEEKRKKHTEEVTSFISTF